jgi:hypothetical protein
VRRCLKTVEASKPHAARGTVDRSQVFLIDVAWSEVGSVDDCRTWLYPGHVIIQAKFPVSA